MFLIGKILNTLHKENKRYQMKFNKKVLINYPLKIFHYHLKTVFIFKHNFLIY